MISDNVRQLRTPSHQPERTSAPESPANPLLGMLPSWELALNEANLSHKTIRSYVATIRALNRWLLANGHTVELEDIDVEHLRGYLVHEKEISSAGNAAKHRRNLSVFWAWVQEEEEREDNPMTRVSKVAVPKKTHETFTDDQMRALLKACSGSGFEDRRDTAIMRVLMDNGMRLSGLAGIRYHPTDDDESDVQLTRHRLRIVLKGGNEHWAPIGRKAAAALDRYIRTRRRHSVADSPYLWLPSRKVFTAEGECRLTGTGIAQMLTRRGEQAGVSHVHAHKFRRTMATGWDGDPLQLMHVGGWNSLEMVRLYSQNGAEERARQAHFKASPGDKI